MLRAFEAGKLGFSMTSLPTRTTRRPCRDKRYYHVLVGDSSRSKKGAAKDVKDDDETFFSQ